MPVTRPVGPPPMTATFTTATPSVSSQWSGVALSVKRFGPRRRRHAPSGAYVRSLGEARRPSIRGGTGSRVGGGGMVRRRSTTTHSGTRDDNVTPHESHLQSDGSVFPPVTPDPPPSPGQPQIEVPDIVPVAAPDGPDQSADTRDTPDATSQSEGSEPQVAPTD